MITPRLSTTAAASPSSHDGDESSSSSTGVLTAAAAAKVPSRITTTTRLLIPLIVPVVVVCNIALSRNNLTTAWNQYDLPTYDDVIVPSSTVATAQNATLDTTGGNFAMLASDAAKIEVTNTNTNNSVDKSRITSNNSNHNNVTLIIGFSDHNYKEIAWRWYQELTKLGYTEHLVVAQDRPTVEYFQEKGMRHDFIHAYDLEKEQLPPSNISNFRQERCLEHDQQYGNAARQQQLYKRSLFGSRWTYVYRQLLAGHNVLLTDVDNVFVRYQNLSELQDEPFESMHAYAGFLDAFPRNLFRQMGFTICGGMSWLRGNSPGLLQVVKTLVERCGCESTLHCHCKCDDQVVINSLLLTEEPYKISWDQTNITVPRTLEDVRWEELTGTVGKTGHRVKVWNRHVAFRRQLDPEVCPDPALSWIAMPSGVDRSKVYDEWKAACPSAPLGDRQSLSDGGE